MKAENRLSMDGTISVDDLRNWLTLAPRDAEVRLDVFLKVREPGAEFPYEPQATLVVEWEV